MFKDALRKAEEGFEETVSDRRHLHKYPELSFQEKATAKYIESKLRQHEGVELRTQVAGHGIVAEITGGQPGPLIALRADMDALPIKELSTHDYVSTNEGVMHACGHDAHSAMLLAAVRNLINAKEQLNGNVRCLFQPAEERLPGGASLMIKEGVLDAPRPKAIIGQHVTPELDVGKVGFRSGPFMASADEIRFTVKGKGGHAAMPHKLIDPVLVTSHLIVALQQFVSRRAKPWIPTVLSFGKVIAEGATNIIPNEVYVEGTLRTFDEEWRSELHRLIPKFAKELCESMGAGCEMDLAVGYPVLVNDEDLTSRCREVAVKLFGAENVVDMDIRMGAEDFAFYSHEIPACFYRLGTGSERPETRSGLHTSIFDIEEEALKIGSALMSAIALNELR